MRRQKRLTKRERHNLRYEEWQASCMEEALRNVVYVDYETQPLQTGRMSSSQPNVQDLPRTNSKAMQMLEEFYRLNPELSGYFDRYIKPEAPRPPSPCLVDADYVDIEQRAIAYIRDDNSTRYKVLLLSSFGDEPLSKLVGIDEPSQEEALR